MEAHANVGFLAALDSSCSNENNILELSKLKYFVLFLNGADPGEEKNTKGCKTFVLHSVFCHAGLLVNLPKAHLHVSIHTSHRSSMSQNPKKMLN